VWRESVIFATADGCGTTEVMRNRSPWCGAARREGVFGLTRDKTRKPGKAPLTATFSALATCPFCRRGLLRIIAAITQESVITRILGFFARTLELVH
jgi:hypothetical protein